MRRLAWVLVALGPGAALADPIPPRVRHKEEVLRQRAEEQKRAAERPPFQWSAPEGFTVTEKQPEGEGVPEFSATSVTPPATMAVFVERSPIVLDDAYVAAQAKVECDKFLAAHPKGTVKVVRKERVKLDTGEAGRAILDTRVDKKQKPMREAHYWLASAGHHAHVVYRAALPQFAKLEKKLDASLRRTKILDAGAPAAPKPEQDRKDVKGP